jgi:hypothetical protein
MQDETSTDLTAVLAGLPQGEAEERLVAMPLPQRLQVIGELCTTDFSGQRDDLDTYALVEVATWSLFRELKDEGRRWAPETADRLLALAETRERPVPMVLRWPVFWAVAKAKVPIAERWDVLLPVAWSQEKRTRTCARAIPKERRARAILDAIAQTVRPVEIGMSLLQTFPSAELAVGILEICDRTGTPMHEVVPKMRELGKKRPKLLVAVEDFVAEIPEPMALVCVRVLRPDRVEALTPLQRRQLEAAGEAYDGRRLTAAERLSDEDEDENVSFLGTLEIMELVDAEQNPAYDVWLYCVDSGKVYRSGTTEVCAEVVHCSVECDDVALRDGLSAVIDGRRRG